ncbi:MAG: ADP-ribose diphosphatase [Legionellales bacterium]|nr:ADP-ribose diphosphatase [Legionellales bacterium]
MTLFKFKSRQVEVESEDSVSYPIFKVQQSRVRHTLHQGGMSDWLPRTCVHRASIVAVLPYDPIQDCFVLIEQFRIGALSESSNPWLIEIVAGMIESYEQPDETARKELLEETGLIADTLTPVHRYFVSPGGSDEYAHVFVATVDSDQSQPIAGVPSEGENIRVLTVSRTAVYEQLSQGQINNSATLIALLTFQQQESRWVSKT